MILQALYDYYQRKSLDPDSDIAPPGFENKEIPFIFVINKAGKLVNIEDTRETEGKAKRAKKFLVPQSVKRAVNVVSNLLWDTPEYCFGIAVKTVDSERLKEMHKAFMARIRKELYDVDDEGLIALFKFLDRNDPASFEKFPAWKEIVQINPFLSFRYEADLCLISQREAVHCAVAHSTKEGGEKSVCIITGVNAPIERLHPAIKGIRGAQTTGANIVSFNLDSFKSFGKDQGMNAPISQAAAFAYTTALNHLLSKDSRQKMSVGDTTIVFWAERPAPLETQIADIFGEPSKDDPDRHIEAVRSLYASFEKGAFAETEKRTKFFILGLSPNASRVSVRFFHVATTIDLANRIKLHFEDMRIQRRTRGDHPEPEYLSLFRILVAVAPQGKAENIPPALSGELVRSILEGTPYPRTLINAAIRRIRSFHEVSSSKVTYPLASILKAYLNRRTRSGETNEKEVKLMLDETNENVGYRLGRLFAVLEKAQEEASPGINATIRDRYYGAASSTPVTVFPILMKLKNHHLAKLENRGRAVNFEKLIASVFATVSDFPAHLRIEDQGRFAIGYYHQRQDFFKKIQKED